VGFPIVVKPPAGAGASSTYRLERPEDLEEYLRTYPPSAARPALAEEFLRGDEHSFDSVMLDGRLVFHSISAYRPNPLTVIENPWIQWCVLLPREIDTAEFAPIRAAGEASLRALGLATGLTHMEWFRRDDGGIAISEVAVRPPGAQFTTLLSYAHDHDFYRAWARLAIFDAFAPPVRRHAAGAAYLRGLGAGRVRRVHGAAEIQREFSDLIVEASWPRPGDAQGQGYEGAGYVIFRHALTARVEHALRRTVETVRVELAAV
jgi:biotin carboxylase